MASAKNDRNDFWVIFFEIMADFVNSIFRTALQDKHFGLQHMWLKCELQSPLITQQDALLGGMAVNVNRGATIHCLEFSPL